ncbi:hypothetical protein AAFN88_16800 [Pelagibius sp. CAU 1746]|uniref:hypothetical protein n=1 Tax=Pelagibius sp. CAU 1746 TaxID=3140370 RepID=UPI00325B5465
MRVLTQAEADSLLQPLDLKVGEWCELACLSSEVFPNKAYRPNPDARELYVLAGHLLDWLDPKDWVILQIDNSTAPLFDESKVFEELAFEPGQRWDLGNQRTFLFGIERAKLILIVFFSLVFEWHVYLTCKSADQGQRLGLQDGIVYFIGRPEMVGAAEAMVERIAENPLRLSQSGK